MWRLCCFLTFLNAKISFSLWVGEISKQKCEEYSKAVYTLQDSPVLMARSAKHLVSEFGIVEVPLIVGGVQCQSKEFPHMPDKNLVSECGIVEFPLIVGGVQCQSKEFPHMAVIGFGLSPNSSLYYQCGGALISHSFVLTAAHCLYSRENGPAQKVKLGTIHLDSEENVQEIQVSARIPHPKYKRPSKYNDIALLKLDFPVNFSPFVRPACLNTNPDITNPTATATGFGKLSYDSTNGSASLMKVQLSVIPKRQCEKSFSSKMEKITMPQGVIDSLVCAGDLAGGKDTCQGDSGGPLQVVLQEPYCMYSLIGITSFGKFCGFANSPALYSRVSYFLDWIELIVWS